MTYIEEKAFYLRDEVAIEEYEGAINQIVIDVKRACKRAYRQHYGIINTQSACLNAMDHVEVTR